MIPSTSTSSTPHAATIAIELERRTRYRDSVMWSRLLALSAVASLLLGCEHPEVLALQPKPNISLPSQAPAVAFELAPEVKDTYTLPRGEGIDEVTVHAWRGTLNNGFRNAFKKGGASSEKVTIKLERAELVFVPAVLTSEGTVVGVRAQVHYRGRWRTPDGEVPFSGTVESKHATPERHELDAISTSAVESMYETIWNALVSGH